MKTNVCTFFILFLALCGVAKAAVLTPSGDGTELVITLADGESYTPEVADLTGFAKITAKMADGAANRGSVILDAAKNFSGLNADWYFLSNVRVAPNNSNSATDYCFGTGKIYVDGAVISSARSGGATEIVNNIEVLSGGVSILPGTHEINFRGKISGEGKLFRGLASYGIRPYGDNSAYTGDIEIQNDWIYTFNKWSAPQAGWAGTGDYSLGSGTITLNTGGIWLGVNDAYIYNDLIFKTSHKLLTGAQKVTILGAISGAAGLDAPNTGYNYAPSEIVLRGDNAAYTGTWSMKSGQMLATDNTNAAKTTRTVDGTEFTGDTRLGGGAIKLSGGVIRADAASTYVHNAVSVTGDYFTHNADGTFTVAANTFRLAGKTLTLTTALTGSGDLAHTGGGTLIFAGGANDFTGDIYLKDGRFEFKNNFTGAGTMYVENGVIACTTALGSARSLDKNLHFVDGTTNTIAASGHEIRLNGAMTGGGTVIREGGGYTCYLSNKNSEFTGNWIIRSDFVKTEHTTEDEFTGKDASFGSGTITLENNAGIRAGGGSSVSYVDNDITVAAGKVGRFRYGTFHLRGDVTVNGTLGGDTGGVPTVQFDGTLSGTGTIVDPAILGAAGTLSPGGDGTLGNLTFTNTLVVQPGTTLAIDVTGKDTSDTLTYTGTSDLDFTDANLKLNIVNPITLNHGDTLDIDFLHETGTGVVSGLDGMDVTFDPEKILFSYDDARLRYAFTPTGMEFFALDANDVPEPSAWLLLLAGFGLLYRRRLAG